MLPVIPLFIGTPINLTGGRFTIVIGLSASIFSFVNITTYRWFALSFTITECDDNDTSIKCIINIIAPPQLCAVVVLRQHIPLPHHPCCPVQYYELVLQ